MNKVTFTFEDGDENIREFKTQADWNCHKEMLYGYKMLYGYTPRFKPDRDPDSFPCLAIRGGMHCEPAGADEEHYIFIYNYKIEKV